MESNNKGLKADLHLHTCDGITEEGIRYDAYELIDMATEMGYDVLGRKTWMRVTSVRPDWLYDDARQCLYIHNPIARYQCGIVIYAMWDIKKLSVFGADWVKRYATEKARLTYGEILSKFSGALPGPVKDLQLDTAKRDKAEKAVADLEAELKASQELTPISID